MAAGENLTADYMMDHECESSEHLKALSVYLSIVEVTAMNIYFMCSVTFDHNLLVF